MLFAIKKYVPKDKRYIDEHYERFVDEIKILFNISHPNIVRIYNYYLYPQAKTGFLQMEYIDGTCIDQYEPMPRCLIYAIIADLQQRVSFTSYLKKNTVFRQGNLENYR